MLKTHENKTVVFILLDLLYSRVFLHFNIQRLWSTLVDIIYQFTNILYYISNLIY